MLIGDKYKAESEKYMADIELVIKIPEEAYKLLKNEGVDWLGAEHILNAVANGMPLPKGHGDLIDSDELWDAYHKNLSCSFYEALDIVNPIIEADEEVDDGNVD